MQTLQGKKYYLHSYIVSIIEFWNISGFVEKTGFAETYLSTIYLQ